MQEQLDRIENKLDNIIDYNDIEVLSKEELNRVQEEGGDFITIVFAIFILAFFVLALLTIGAITHEDILKVISKINNFVYGHK